VADRGENIVVERLRLRAWARGGLVGVLAAAILALVPVAPASAIQTMSWVVAPPATAHVGDTVNFTWTGRADTFLGARITGCFANFPDAPNYTNSFGGNFTTGNCTITNRVVTTSPTYTVQVGFTLSTGGQMTMTWNIAVASTPPTLVNLPTGNTLNLTADTASGATVPAWNVYGQDSTYGTYSATCTPAAGTIISAPGATGSCSATNPGGQTTTRAVTIIVAKGTPATTWNVAGQYDAGTLWAQVMDAAVTPTGLTGTWAYQDANGNAIASNAAIPVGTTQVTATFTPSGASATNWSSVSITRSITAVATTQSVSFSSPPSTKTYGNAPFPVSATGTAGGGQVTIGARAGSPCTVASPSGTTTVTATVTLTGAGSCVLLADQAAVAQYTAAPQAGWTVAVGKATPAVTFASAPAPIVYGTTLASVLDATGSVPGTIRYTINGTPVSATTVLNAGTYPITATLTPTDSADYTTASATIGQVVNRADAGLSIAPIADTTYGAAAPQVVATVTSPATRQYSTSTANVCTVASTGLVTLVGAGTCSITASLAATANYLAASTSVSFDVAPATPGLAWPAPADVVYGTALDATQLNAVLDTSAFPFGTPAMGDTVYTYGGGLPVDGATPGAGDHVITATWTPFDTFASRYQAVTRTVTLHVAKATAAVSWAVPADITDGTALGGDQLNATADQPGTFTYTLDDQAAPASGQKPAIGDHVLHVRFVPDSGNYSEATAEVPLTVVPSPETPDTLGPDVQHQVDEQRVEAQADLSAGETRTISVGCPSGYLATDGAGRVDAVDQGTGTLADVHVLESRATSLDTWTVTMTNRATGRAQGKVFADCVQRETSTYDGHRHALVVDRTVTEPRLLAGPTTVTATCADGRSPIAPGFVLDGDAVVRRSAADGTSAWTWHVVPTGATTGTFSVRCLAPRVSTVDGHDHRLVLTQVADRVTVGAGQSVEAQTTCGDLARGIVGGWSLDDGLVLAGSEPRAKTRAVRLVNPTSGPLSADLTVQCLETRTEGGSDGRVPATASATAAAPAWSPAPAAAAAVPTPFVTASTVALSARAVAARGRVTTAVSCLGGTTGCDGAVRLVALRTQRVGGKVVREGTLLARGSYRLSVGATGSVVLKVTTAGKRALSAGLRQGELRAGGVTRTVRLR
jgi:hypothetical protein